MEILEQVSEKLKKVQGIGQYGEMWINEKEVSLITGRAIQTLRNDRFKGIGIPYTKLKRSCRYALSDVYLYMESQKIHTDLNS
jgi:hypothetical protein